MKNRDASPYNTLFLQSDIENLAPFYDHMLRNSPLYLDSQHKLWAVYSYALCDSVLRSRSAAIPALRDKAALHMSDCANSIRTNLIRLTNPPLHTQRRNVIKQLFDLTRPVDYGEVLGRLLNGQDRANLDWVQSVCKKLPAMAILQGFNFPDELVDFIASRVDPLTKLMSSVDYEDEAKTLNRVVNEVYPPIANHLTHLGTVDSIAITDSHADLDRGGMLEVLASNLIGFLIQSYDAGRGLLSNALLAYLNHVPQKQAAAMSTAYFQRVVHETLRFDSPVQNTRRVLIDDVTLNGVVLKAGSPILIVLAAANRDAAQFERPHEFDTQRANNHDHLTLGAGAHACLAQHIMPNMVAETLAYLFQTYPNTRLLDGKIDFEPRVNVRMPKEIQISLQ